MASFNRVIMMGNLTRDPEHKQLTSGQSVCKLSLASNRQFKNRQTGTMVQEVCFVDIDVWGAQADSSSKYLRKGSAVLIEGRLKFDTWQDADGQKRSKHSITADRVTFLPASQSVSTDEVVASANKIEEIAEKHTKGASSNQNTSEEEYNQKESSSGEVDFKDEKPFEDDLPF
ncbi:single-stranded DNA-binding protein [Candidatus Dependentiae bacterium]|nr:single-stranded DNA-binding protein [Candidatus Dependentiae bacterium]